MAPNKPYIAPTIAIQINGQLFFGTNAAVQRTDESRIVFREEHIISVNGQVFFSTDYDAQL